MPLRFLLYLTLILFGRLCVGQNMQIAYDFDRLPQTLMLNPGAEIDFDQHYGVPLLSNLYFQFGASNTGVTYNNVVQGTDDLNQILTNLNLQNPSSSDVYVLNQQLEIFNVGFRMRDTRDYLSFGLYQEASGFGSHPKDITDLFFNGNDQNGDGIPETDDPYDLSELNAVGELIGVWHVGINRTVNDRLTLGGRLKLYSGALSIQTQSKSGIYSLSQVPFGFEHVFQRMNAGINSSGLVNNQGVNVVGDPAEILANALGGGGNYGFGIDFGFTVKSDNDLTFTGSIRDLGFINFSNDVTTYEIKEDFSIEDVPFDPPEGQEVDYWDDLWTGYYEAGLLEDKLDTLASAYTQIRPVKLSGSVKKTKTRRKKINSAYRTVSCDQDFIGDTTLESEYGLQVYSEFRPVTVLWAVTGFYSRQFSKSLNAKFTYTVDRFSFYNIGVGVSARIKQFNLFVAADNLLALPTVRDSNYQSFQLGMNVIIK